MTKQEFYFAARIGFYSGMLGAVLASAGEVLWGLIQ